MDKKGIIIRRETENDYRAVENLVREAFWNVYRPGCMEHFVLHRFRSSPDFVPELDFVMEKDGCLIGQNIFWGQSVSRRSGSGRAMANCCRTTHWITLRLLVVARCASRETSTSMEKAALPVPANLVFATMTCRKMLMLPFSCAKNCAPDIWTASGEYTRRRRDTLSRRRKRRRLNALMHSSRQKRN